MFVPCEKSERQRSASLGSIRTDDFQTMEPGDKFVAPRPAPPVPALPDFLGPAYRLPTAPAVTTLKHHKSDRAISRSISPTPSWWSPRKLFTRKQSTSSQGSGCPSMEDVSSSSVAASNDYNRCSTALSTATTESSRIRAMSPESLRRFLSDDTPLSGQSSAQDNEDEEDPLGLSIPDDLAEDDDDDFLVSAASEFGPKTILSPPPVSRHNSSSTHASTTRRVIPTSSINLSSLTLTAATAPLSPRQLPQQLDVDDDTPTSRFSFSSDEDSEDEADTSSSPAITDNETPSFYNSDADLDEDDEDSSRLSSRRCRRVGMGRASLEQSLALALDNYRLPGDDDASCREASTTEDATVSVVSSPPLLALPVIDDFVGELKSAGLSF